MDLETLSNPFLLTCPSGQLAYDNLWLGSGSTVSAYIEMQRRHFRSAWTPMRVVQAEQNIQEDLHFFSI